MTEKVIQRKTGVRKMRMKAKSSKVKPVPVKPVPVKPVPVKQSKTKRLRKKKITCILLNARSIINKIEELEALVYEKHPDMIFITESWAKEKHAMGEISLQGYDCHRNDRITTERGGGCIIFAKSELKTVMIEELTKVENTDTVWCKYEDTTIGVCYNTTANTVEQEEPLIELIRKACENTSEVVVTGDFNHETINWELMEAQAEGEKFLEVTEDLFLTQHVKDPTRGKNILDLILSTNPHQVNNVKVLERFGKSDHNMIEFEIETGHKPDSWKTKYRDFRKADFNKIRDELKAEGCRNDSNMGVAESLRKLTAKLEKAVDRNVPLKERSMNKPPKPMWWNRKIKKLRKNRLKWWNRFKENGSDRNEAKYKYYQKEVNKEIRRAKRNLEKRLGENIKTDRKGFFKYARSKMKVKESVGPIEDQQGRLIKDEKEMANIFSEFFKSVFTKENINEVPVPEKMFHGNESEELKDINIDVDRVKKKLKSLNKSKAPGNDEINPALLSEAAEEIAEEVADIFRKSLDEGVVPEEWRTSNITPIHKKDSRSKAENYRGVHLTSQLCKTLEGIIKEDIVEHLVKNMLIRDTQHGFWGGRSCITNLLEFLEEVTKNVDEGNPCDIIYMDFQKAFDKVPHERLLKKLESHGITGKVHKWIAAWLRNRKQQVVLKGKKSIWEDVLSGVPQGSILGPVLFLIYINDIDSGILSTLSKFADDCKLTRKVTCEKDQDDMQTDLDTLESWSEKWQMAFHPDKCKVLHIGHNNRKSKYYINGIEITEVQEEKDLGIVISEDLKPKKHIARIVKKANRLLGMIYRTITCKNQSNIMNLYKTLIRPILDYGAAVWCPHQKTDIIKIEKIQRRATKMIRKLRNLPYEERLRRCNLTSLETRRRRYDLIETFKMMKNIYKVNPEKLFKMKESETRGHNLKIFKQQCRLNSRKYFFSQRVVNDWNKLPKLAVQAKNLQSFKTIIDKEFKTGGLYMIQ